MAVYLCLVNQSEDVMKIVEFMKKYPDEASCKAAWKRHRDRIGVVCPVCGGIVHYWKRDKECYECKGCHHRQSLRANTVMHGSQLPFRYWFIAMFLLSGTKKSFSAAELQRQVGHKNYAPIWALLHKLRLSMGQCESSYQLDGIIELDEGYFSTETPDDQKNMPLKRGRGSQRKTKVLVMAETELPTEEEAAKAKKCGRNKPTKVGRIKMMVVEDLKSGTIESAATKNISPESAIITDDSTSYTNFHKLFRSHHAQVILKEQIGTVLPWVHIAISNAKRMILDVFHDVTAEYLQSYLNEFCFKFNRRYEGGALFYSMLTAAIKHKNQFRYNIA